MFTEMEIRGQRANMEKSVVFVQQLTLNATGRAPNCQQSNKRGPGGCKGNISPAYGTASCSQQGLILTLVQKDQMGRVSSLH